VAWLYRQAWADDVAPSVLFRAAHRRLLGEQILLPGQSMLARLARLVAWSPGRLVAWSPGRLVAGVRERAARTPACSPRHHPSCGPGWRSC